MDASTVNVQARSQIPAAAHTLAPSVQRPSPCTHPRLRPRPRSPPPSCPHPAVLPQAGQESVLRSSRGRRGELSNCQNKQKKACARRRGVALGRGDAQGYPRRLAANKPEAREAGVRRAGSKAELRRNSSVIDQSVHSSNRVPKRINLFGKNIVDVRLGREEVSLTRPHVYRSRQPSTLGLNPAAFQDPPKLHPFLHGPFRPSHLV